jgi:hypothetical protein
MAIRNQNNATFGADLTKRFCDLFTGFVLHRVAQQKDAAITRVNLCERLCLVEGVDHPKASFL